MLNLWNKFSLDSHCEDRRYFIDTMLHSSYTVIAHTATQRESIVWPSRNDSSLPLLLSFYDSSRPSTAVILCTLGLHKNYPRMILDYHRKFKLEQIPFEKTQWLIIIIFIKICIHCKWIIHKIRKKNFLAISVAIKPIEITRLKNFQIEPQIF